MSGKINAIAIETAKNADQKAIMTIVTSDQSKSAKIRALHTSGVDRSTIASLLTNFYGKEVRYQHVRNVLVTELTGSKKEVVTVREMVEGDL